MQLLCWWLLERIQTWMQKQKNNQLPLLFWAVKVSWRCFFRKTGAYVFAKRQFFETLSFRKWKTSFSQTFTTWKRKNVLKSLSRAIPSTFMNLKCIFSHLRRCSRSISFLLHSTACVQWTRWKIRGKEVSLFLDFFLVFSTLSELWAKNFQHGCPVYNQSVHWNILKKVFVQRTKPFFESFFQFPSKKNILFLAIIFETVVETACFGYRRLLWEEKIFPWVFLILIFALPKKWFRS